MRSALPMVSSFYFFTVASRPTFAYAGAALSYASCRCPAAPLDETRASEGHPSNFLSPDRTRLWYWSSCCRNTTAGGGLATRSARIRRLMPDTLALRSLKSFCADIICRLGKGNGVAVAEEHKQSQPNRALGQRELEEQRVSIPKSGRLKRLLPRTLRPRSALDRLSSSCLNLSILLAR